MLADVPVKLQDLFVVVIFCVLRNLELKNQRALKVGEENIKQLLVNVWASAYHKEFTPKMVAMPFTFPKIKSTTLLSF